MKAQTLLPMELIDYLLLAKKAGISFSQVEAKLVSSGWDKESLLAAKVWYNTDTSPEIISSSIKSPKVWVYTILFATISILFIFTSYYFFANKNNSSPSLQTNLSLSPTPTPTPIPPTALLLAIQKSKEYIKQQNKAPLSIDQLREANVITSTDSSVLYAEKIVFKTSASGLGNLIYIDIPIQDSASNLLKYIGADSASGFDIKHYSHQDIVKF